MKAELIAAANEVMAAAEAAAALLEDILEAEPLEFLAIPVEHLMKTGSSTTSASSTTRSRARSNSGTLGPTARTAKSGAVQ